MTKRKGKFYFQRESNPISHPDFLNLMIYSIIEKTLGPTKLDMPKHFLEFAKASNKLGIQETWFYQNKDLCTDITLAKTKNK